MAMMTYLEAIADAMRIEMRKDERVWLCDGDVLIVSKLALVFLEVSWWW